MVVDGPVWIAGLRDEPTEAIRKLRALDLTADPVVVPDLVLLEVLRGARDEALAARIERNLGCFDIVNLGDAALAVSAARHYRALRRLGVTIRSSIDLLIGAFCIERGAFLLHQNRADFGPCSATSALSASDPPS